MANTQSFPFQRINAETTKHQLTRKQLQEFLADALDKLGHDAFVQVFGRNGILPFLPSGVATPLELIAGVGNDTFRIRSGIGLICDHSSAAPPLIDWTNPGADITVENALGTTYHIGMRLQQVPLSTADGISVNPRTGVIEYVAKQMVIGEMRHPDSVVDNGDGTVTLNVSNLMAAGGALRNHGDRAALVWLATPASPSHLVAFQSAVAGWVGGFYKIVDMPACGQAIGSVSTNVNSYWVLVPGPTVTTLDIHNPAAYPHYLYLGSFAGAGAGNPIGAVSTANVYRFGSTLGTIDADVWTLFRDVYTAPSRDGDGLANLATPIQTTLETHLNGGASKHDATEIDDETGGGLHGTTVQATLNNLASELIARPDIHDVSDASIIEQQTLRGGLVDNLTAFGELGPLDQVWGNAGTAGLGCMASDGEKIWLGSTTVGQTLQRLERPTGDVEDTGPKVGGIVTDLAGPLLACAGDNVYGIYNPGGGATLYAIDRDSLQYLYGAAAPYGLGTLRKIATDGRYVALVGDDKMMLYLDTGAALNLIGTWTNANAKAVNDIAMNGRFIVVGCNAQAAPGYNQINVLSYVPASLVAIQRVTDAGVPDGANVTHIAFDGERIAFGGDADADGDTVGLLRSRLVVAHRWKVATTVGALCFVEGKLAVVRQSVDVDLYDVEQGELADQYTWSAGVNWPQQITFDGDALILRGQLDAGDRVRRLMLHPEGRMLLRWPASASRHRDRPSCVVPLNETR